jgi:hypothetical protein
MEYLQSISKKFLTLLPENSIDTVFKWVKDENVDCIFKLCSIAPALFDTSFEAAFFELVSGFIGTMLRFYQGRVRCFEDGVLAKEALVTLCMVMESRVRFFVANSMEGDFPVGNFLKLMHVITNDPNFAEFYDKNKYRALLEKFKKKVEKRNKYWIEFTGEIYPVTAQELLNIEVEKKDNKPQWFYF